MSAKRFVAVLADSTNPVFRKPPVVPNVEFIIGDLTFLRGRMQEVAQADCLISLCVTNELARQMIELWADVPKVKWVHSFSAGIDKMKPFLDACMLEGRGADIPLTNGRSAFSSSLAEWVATSVLHFNKQIPRCQQNRIASNYERFTMDVVDAKTIGFVGFGDISVASAKVMKAFGMRVLAMRRNAAKGDDSGLADEVFSNEQAAQMFPQCDYIVSVLPGTPETNDFFNAERFALMKEGSVFISIGRGSVVDEDALVAALKSGHLKGAALDVFKTEPLPKESTLWGCETLLLSAHNADLTADYADLGWKVWQRNYAAFLEGKPFVTPADRRAGY